MTRKRVIIICTIISLLIIARYSPLKSFLNFEAIKNNAHMFKDFAAHNYLISIPLYIICYTIVTGFSLPGAASLTILGGFLFGVLQATIFVNIGATLGATGAFLLTRHLLGTSLQQRYNAKLAIFNRHMRKQGISYLLFVRLVPVFPFFVINVLAGLTKIPIKSFIWTTSLGIIPGSIAYTFFGRQIETIQNPSDILSANLLIAFFMLGLLAFIPVFISKIRFFWGKSR